MNGNLRFRLDEAEQQIIAIASEQLNIPREKLSGRSRLIEDLHCDSLELLDLIYHLEDSFEITFPVDSPDPVYKAVFTRKGLCLADLAEMAYISQDLRRIPRRQRRKKQPQPAPESVVRFTQLSGRWESRADGSKPLFEPAGMIGQQEQLHRCSDGMRCIALPAAKVEIGCDDSSMTDERPRHTAEISAFLIDAEPVSTTAYCRFLNSVGCDDPETLAEWFVLDPEDDRQEHMLIQRTTKEGWQPLPGAERWPMILVSWFGANAYSLWANGRGWQRDHLEGRNQPKSFLPTEAQWEYAARGASDQTFPCGNEISSSEQEQLPFQYGRHSVGTTYDVQSLPLADVNAPLGVSPFGLHHMAGNVWQWCRDWYNPSFYASPEATQSDPVNRTPGHARSERGGSWVGPAELCRSSFRRGRPPLARGRCLGFRCVSLLADVSG